MQRPSESARGECCVIVFDPGTKSTRYTDNFWSSLESRQCQPLEWYILTIALGEVMKNLNLSTADEERVGKKNSYNSVYHISYLNLVILDEMSTLSSPNGDINRCAIPRVLLCLSQTLYQSPGKDALHFRCKNERGAKSLMDRSRVVGNI